MSNDQLLDLVEDLVWDAWQSGRSVGESNLTTRAVNDRANELFRRVEALRRDLDSSRPEGAAGRFNPGLV